MEKKSKQREPYIAARNNILDNPFKYFFPYYKRKLREIDFKLDEIDDQNCYESKNIPTKVELENIIIEVKQEINKYLEKKRRL